MALKPRQADARPDDARSAAAGSDDAIPTGHALVATRACGRRWLLTSGLGLLTALLGPPLGRSETDLLDSGNPQLAAEHPPGFATRDQAVAVLIGSGLLLWGQSRSFGSIQQALASDKDTVLVDALRAKSRLNRGPNIVAIGGGTGLSTLLSGLGAIAVTSPPSSPLLRWRQQRSPPTRTWGTAPRRHPQLPCRPLHRRATTTCLFQYRFSTGSGLEGHSFGNLFLSALSAITGIWKPLLALQPCAGGAGPGGAVHQRGCASLGRT